MKVSAQFSSGSHPRLARQLLPRTAHLDSQPSDAVQLSRCEPRVPDQPARPGGWERLWKAVIPPTLHLLGAPIASLVSLAGGLWERLHPGPLESPPPAPQPNLLEPLPAAELKRPLLVVPGFNYDLKAFDDLTAKLTEDGANGGQAYYLRQGKVFEDAACSLELVEVPKAARVFVAALEQGNDPPPQSALELAQDLDRITRVTGQSKVDVAAHSMGGLATRRYLDFGGDKVGNLMMVGTPNQGATLASASLKLLDYARSGWPVAWALRKKSIREADREAYEWLRTATPDSPLGRLNQRSQAQLNQLEAGLIVGADQIKTYGRAFWKVGGDGTVPASSLTLEGWPCETLPSPALPQHGNLLRDPQVYRRMGEFFGWDGPGLS